MLKITTPKLLMILAVLVGVYFVVQYTGNKGRSKSYRTELVNIDPEKVTKVRLTANGNITLLTKEGEEWFVEQGSGRKRAKTNLVTSMLSNLNSIEPSRIASRSEDKWQDFSVDSTGTRVEVYGGNALLTDIVLGRFGVEGQRSFFTYVRLSEDEDTYVANNFMKMSVNTNPEDYRNNEIIRLQSDSLTTISFNYPDSSMVLTKEGSRWMSENGPADSAAVVQYIRGLRTLTSKNFAEEPVNSTPELNVTFGFSNQPERQISAFRQENEWIIQSSENEHEVWNDKAQFDKIFAAVSNF